MKILIAYDGSEHSKMAIDDAIDSPWPKSSEFKVITVVDDSLSGSAFTDTAQVVVEAALAKLRAGLPQVERIEGQVLVGYPKAQILESLERWPSDLLIVGSRGRKGLQSFVLGSVSHSLLLSAACSVRIARKRQRIANGVQRVLMALDGSEFSHHVVSRIASRPWQVGTEFLCVTSVPTLSEYLDEVQDSHEIDNVQKARDSHLAKAETHLEHECSVLRLKLAGVITSSQIINGDPRQSIVRAAKQWGADIIVTGCKGKNWVSRMLIGSVSEFVATWAECSVEVVKK